MATYAQLDEHYGYLADTRRTELFRKAIQDTLQPGDTVLDLGCGTGILGLLCLEAGAGHVTFLDETEMIDVAQRSMQNAGFIEKCTFIQERSTQATIPERVDLIVCDNVGYFGIDYSVLVALKDAKDRFLKPDGRLIPKTLRLYAGLADSPVRPTPVSRWRQPEIPDCFHWLSTLSANYKWPVKDSEIALLSEATQLTEFSLGDDSPDFANFSQEMSVVESGVSSGIVGWFEANLSSEVVMTNCPTSPNRIDRPQAFFSFGAGLTLDRGESVKASIKTRLDDDIWVWQAEVRKGGARCMHSTLNAITRAQLQLSQKDQPMTLSKRAQISKAVLTFCDGHRSAEEIEELVVSRHGNLFATEHALRTAIRRDLARFTDSM